MPGYIGVDLGGTKAAAVRLDGDLTVVARHRTVARTGKPDLVDRAVDAVRALWVEDTVAVGVGIAGLVRWPDGVFAWGPHVAGTEVAVRAALEQRLGVPVIVDNDANTAALAEIRQGAARGYDHVLVVTLGTGIGGAIVAGGEVYRGSSFAGEFGHMTVLDDGPVCDCGRRGCWETLASGPALARMALEVIARSPRSPFAARFRNAEPLAEAVTAAAAEGDEVAAGLVAQAGEHFGRGLANLIAALDPQMVVIGGGLGSVGEALIGPARDVVGERLHGPPGRVPPPVVAAAMGEAAGAIGAALLAASAVAGRSGSVCREDRAMNRIEPDEPPRDTRTWRELVTETALLLPNFLKLIYRLMRDRRVPVRRKVVVGAVLGYLVSPIDVIPDVIPVIGQVDDVLLIAYAVHHLIDGAGREVVMEYWDGAEDAFELIEAVIEWGSDLVPAPVRRLIG